jgi:opacity protein-like surface antigen
MKRYQIATPYISVFFISLLIVCFNGQYTFAQDYQDITGIRMNDGTVIEGTVIQMSAEIVKIRTKDGKVVTRKFSDVDNFIRTGDGENTLAMKKQLSGYHLGIIGGLVVNHDASFEVLGRSFDVELNDSAFFGVRAGYTLPTVKYCRLEVEFNHIFDQDADNQTILSSGTNSLSINGQVNLNNLLFNIIFIYPEGVIRPYVGAGLGWSWFQVNGTASANIGGTTYVLSDSARADSFAWQFMAGVELRANDNFSFDFSYRYLGTDPKINEFDIEYRAGLLALGLNIYF